MRTGWRVFDLLRRRWHATMCSCVPSTCAHYEAGGYKHVCSLGCEGIVSNA
jgi:hypothetical protein